METFSTLLALCAGNSPVTGEFPSQRPVTRSFIVFFNLRPPLNKRLSKQSWGWWFETPSLWLWRHYFVWVIANTTTVVHLTRCGLVTLYTWATWLWVNIGLGIGLLPDVAKQLLELLLTNHQRGLVIFIWYEGNFMLSVLDMSLKISSLRLQPHLPGANGFTRFSKELLI